LCNPRANFEKWRIFWENSGKGLATDMAMRKIFRRFCVVAAGYGTLSVRIG
jgi:hypothetical protein